MGSPPIRRWWRLPGPVSTEVTGTEHDQIMAVATVPRKIARIVCIKVPLTPDGLRACSHLRRDGTMVNVTLCLPAAKAML